MAHGAARPPPIGLEVSAPQCLRLSCALQMRNAHIIANCNSAQRVLFLARRGIAVAA